MTLVWGRTKLETAISEEIVVKVSDRWMPVLAATVGIIGGLGGALVGGCVANQGQQEQFENERQAALVDMRREVYATYIQALEAFIQLGPPGKRRAAWKRPSRGQELIEEEGVEALTAQAAAELVAGDDVRKAVKDIDEAMRRPTGFKDEAEWLDLRDRFIARAHDELFPDE